MTAITPELLAEIEALAAAATPGPWTVQSETRYGDRDSKEEIEVWNSGLEILIGTEIRRAHKDGGVENMAYIAAMDPSTTLALVAHVREVEADLAHVTAGWKSAMERAKAERDALAAKLKEAKEALTDALAHLTAANSLLSRSSKKAAPSDKMFDQMLADYKASEERCRAALSRLTAEPANVEPRFDLVAHLERQRAFSLKTFGPGARTKGVTDHIAKELDEIRADPSDISEWVDVIILGFDGAWRAGWEPEDIVVAILAKQAKNEARVWPDWRTADPDKAIEHDRSHDVEPASKGDEG